VVVDPRFGNGTIYLVPELGRCPYARANLVARGVIVPSGATASYRFSSAPGRNGQQRLVFTVFQGSALVRWSGAKENLQVFAGDQDVSRELQPNGTVFAVMVDRATNSAAVYVQEGVVTSPFGGVSASPGEALVFQGQTVTVASGFGSGFLDDIKHQSETVWTSGGNLSSNLRSDVFIDDGGGGIGGKLLLGGVLIGGGAYYLMKEKKKESKSYPITIVISIPIF